MLLAAEFIETQLSPQASLLSSNVVFYQVYSIGVKLFGPVDGSAYGESVWIRGEIES